ncbi:hypothetical protein EDC02_7082 [Micromonospora sp. Llam0]|nr:hypothetical protein EDC02_7082 [Micromonospora sp. Llam0]
MVRRGRLFRGMWGRWWILWRGVRGRGFGRGGFRWIMRRIRCGWRWLRLSCGGCWRGWFRGGRRCRFIRRLRLVWWMVLVWMGGIGIGICGSGCCLVRRWSVLLGMGLRGLWSVVRIRCWCRVCRRWWSWLVVVLGVWWWGRCGVMMVVWIGFWFRLRRLLLGGLMWIGGRCLLVLGVGWWICRRIRSSDATTGLRPRSLLPPSVAIRTRRRAGGIGSPGSRFPSAALAGSPDAGCWWHPRRWAVTRRPTASGRP